MNYKIIAYGKPSLMYAQQGIAEYRLRLSRFVKVEEIFLKAGKNQMQFAKGSYCIALDERGKALDTAQWASALKQLQAEGIKTLSFLIGDADGHSEMVRKEANCIWQLAPMTLNHELALLVLWEQIYRTQCVLAGHPYHRE